MIAGNRIDLLEALEKDNTDLVEAVVLRDVTELDYHEIARLLDLPLSTVMSRIHYARLRIIGC